MRIGGYTMIGMNSVITRHVPPYATVVGRHFTKINRVGLEIRNAQAADIEAIEAYYTNRLDGNAPKSVWISGLKLRSRLRPEKRNAPSVRSALSAADGNVLN